VLQADRLVQGVPMGSGGDELLKQHTAIKSTTKIIYSCQELFQSSTLDFGTVCHTTSRLHSHCLFSAVVWRLNLFRRSFPWLFCCAH